MTILFNHMTSILLVSLLTVIKQISCQNIPSVKRKQDLFKINNPNSSKVDALLEHNTRVSFYENKIKSWDNQNIIELIQNNETLEIALKAKKDLDFNNGIKLKYKYFLNTCDFVPFKEVIGEYLMELLQKQPELNNETFLNNVFLTYQILYYRNASPLAAENYYKLIWFKNQSSHINKKVFKMKLHKKVEYYFTNIIPKHNFKAGAWFFSSQEEQYAKDFGLDLNSAKSIKMIIEHINKRLLEDQQLFDKDPSYFFINKYNLDKTKAVPLKKEEIKVHRDALTAVIKFATNKKDFYDVFSFIIKTMLNTSMDFYSLRYQNDDKTDYEFYLKQVGQFSNKCHFIGPLADIFDLEIVKNPKLTDVISTDLEFTSFNDVNLYFNSKIVKDSFVRVSYNFTIPNEQMLLDFRSELYYNDRLIQSDYNINSNKNNTDISKQRNTVLQLLDNPLDFFTFPLQLTKKQFSVNQYKLCKLISCGGSNDLTSILENDQIQNNKALEFPFLMISHQLNSHLFNLLRIFELDDYISTIPISDMESFRDKFIYNKKVSHVEDIKALTKYFELLFSFDKKSKNYSFIIQDYIKMKNSLLSLEGFGNALSEKLYFELGNNVFILKNALNNKALLYSQYEVVLDKIKEEIDDEIKGIKKEMLKFYVKK